MTSKKALIGLFLFLLIVIGCQQLPQQPPREIQSQLYTEYFPDDIMGGGRDKIQEEVIKRCKQKGYTNFFDWATDLNQPVTFRCRGFLTT